jgi:propionyl-CoA synthetase
MRRRGGGAVTARVASIDALHARSLEDPEGFWREAAGAIAWRRAPERVCDAADPMHPHWFPGGELNACENALDRHVAAGHGARTALVYDSPVTGVVRAFSYAELLDEVARAAGMLAELGVGPGDRVVIYMPMVPEAVMAMLACARLGAVHSVVFGGFAPHELAIRIDDARPKVLVTASCGIEAARVIPYKPLIDRALELAAHRPERVVVVARPQAEAALEPGRDEDWARRVERAGPAPAAAVASTDPLYILYTSGTTGRPKGVVRDTGGHAVALAWTMEAIYDARAGDVYWAASDVGWVVGHSYIVYAPLFAGCTTVLYEGKPVGTPDPGAFWRVIADHGVKTLFTAPTALRAIKKEDPAGAHLERYDLSRFEALFLAGERLDPDTYHWASRLLGGRPVIDHWWQTETGWPIAATCLGVERSQAPPGSAGRPVPGFDVRVLGPDGSDAAPGEDGAIALRLPLPPGALTTLWGDDERFRRSYFAAFPGHYTTADGGRFDADGFLFVMGRTDDVINVAGHRLSTGAMEEVVARHPDVAECAVFGVPDELRGQVPLGLVVLKAGVTRAAADVCVELVAMVRDEVGAVACFREARVVPRLPKTRSGKVLRGTMRAMAEGREVPPPSTIEDPAALDEIAAVLAER